MTVVGWKCDFIVAATVVIKAEWTCVRITKNMRMRADMKGSQKLFEIFKPYYPFHW